MASTNPDGYGPFEFGWWLERHLAAVMGYQWEEESDREAFRRWTSRNGLPSKGWGDKLRFVFVDPGLFGETEDESEG